jgi:hypothetical protein
MYNTRDVVREREVVRHNDYRPHQPNYCGEPCEDTCCERPDPCWPCQPMRNRPRFWQGRRW